MRPYAGLRHGRIFFAQSRGELEHNHSMLMAILAGTRGRIVQFPNEGPPPRSVHLPDQATWISMGHGMGRVVALSPKKTKTPERRYRPRCKEWVDGGTDVLGYPEW